MRNVALIAITFLFLLQTIATVIVNHRMVQTMKYQAAVIERQKLVIQRQWIHTLTHNSDDCKLQETEQ